MAATAKVTKAATAVVARGGPEDPVGDAVAAKELVTPAKTKSSQSPSKGSEPSGAGKSTKTSSKALPAPSKGSKKGKGVLGKAVALVPGKNLLVGEVTVCLIILVWGTIVAPKGSNDGVTRMMVKGSALLGVFFILALISTGGKGPAKVASSLGVLITLSYMLTSSDMHDIVTWINTFFKKPSTTTEEK